MSLTDSQRRQLDALVTRYGDFQRDVADGILPPNPERDFMLHYMATHIDNYEINQMVTAYLKRFPDTE